MLQAVTGQRWCPIWIKNVIQVAENITPGYVVHGKNQEEETQNVHFLAGGGNCDGQARLFPVFLVQTNGEKKSRLATDGYY